MSTRVLAAAACVLLSVACQRGGPPLASAVGVTGPSAISIKAVDVPFSGGVNGEAAFDFVENPNACPSGFTTITTGTGTATHMGRTTWFSTHCLGEGNQIVDSWLVLTAANGDEVHITYTGACPGSAEVGETFTCSGTSVVVGGTGRFADASGNLEWHAAIVFEGFGDFSWPGRWEWSGTIRY